MNRIYSILFVFFFSLPFCAMAQTVNVSDFERDDTRDMNFEIIGKINGNILVYKNIRSNHKITIFDKEMNTIESVKLAFMPERTFNVDFISYANHFFIVYQYQKGTILHCMAVKMNAQAQSMGEPVEIDTTRIPLATDNKIYSTIYSEDRSKIAIFKIQTRYQKFNMQTLIFDSEMKLIGKNRLLNDYNERKDSYDNFSLGNDGSFVFTVAKQPGNRDNSNALSLVIKPPLQDVFAYQEVDLKEKYVDEIKLKIDNKNSRYLLNTFYYSKNRGNIEGLFTYIWDRADDKKIAQFTQIYDSLRAEAKNGGMLRFALDDFFIRNIIVKGDGGFVLAAEDFSSNTRGNNNFNRYDYLFNPYSFSPGGYYYDPYRGYYRPFNNFNNQQSTRYYYDNILILGFSKAGQLLWSRVLHKSQFDDDEENFMSFSTMTSGSEIHFLFNEDKKFQIISDQAVSADGTVTRYPTLKSPQKGYEFMPGLSKQTGANQIIVPCAYRNNICFAKIDF